MGPTYGPRSDVSIAENAANARFHLAAGMNADGRISIADVWL